MPRKTEERTIDGVQYRVTQMGMDTADEFIFRVGRVAASLFDGSAGLFQALQGLSPAEFKWAVGTLKETTEVLVIDQAASADARTGEKPARWVKLATVYNTHFTGDHMGAWRKWIAFATEVCFGRFFVDLLEDIRARMAGSTSNSLAASDGSSGGSSSTSA